jgi:hypothetical protein
MPEVIYGGPYMEESAAIEAELMHAHNENREPDLWGLFADKVITQGAVNLIETHTNPPAPYEGDHFYAPAVERPSEDYVFPGEGGPNTVDDESIR